MFTSWQQQIQNVAYAVYARTREMTPFQQRIVAALVVLHLIGLGIFTYMGGDNILHCKAAFCRF